MKKKGWIILISILVFIFAAGTLGVLSLKQKAERAMSPPTGFGGPSAIVSKGEIKSGIYTSGSVRPAEAIDFPYDPSQDITFNVENGEEVKKGKLLFEINDSEMELQYEEAVSDRDRMKSEIAKLRDLPEETELEVEAQINQLEMELKNAQSRVNQLSNSLEKNKIKAPFDGTVTLSKDLPTPTEGGVDQGRGASFVRLVNHEELIISVPIDEIDYPQVKVGDKVNVSLVAYENENFSGSITYLGREATNQSGRVAFPAVVTLDPDEKILPGMTADVWVVFAEKNDILVVPSETVFDGENGEQYVNVLTEEGGMEMRPIKTGISDDNQIEIIEGLQEGERLEMPMMGDFMPMQRY